MICSRITKNNNHYVKMLKKQTKCQSVGKNKSFGEIRRSLALNVLTNNDGSSFERKIKILDVGSCYNPFYHPSKFNYYHILPSIFNFSLSFNDMKVEHFDKSTWLCFSLNRHTLYFVMDLSDILQVCVKNSNPFCKRSISNRRLLTSCL